MSTLGLWVTQTLKAHTEQMFGRSRSCLTLRSDTTAATADGGCIRHACSVLCVPVLRVVTTHVCVRYWHGASIRHFHCWDRSLRNHHRVVIANRALNISM
jgi:hypothetical protein